jgi:hypothetical protein
MKAVDRADQHLSYCTILKKNKLEQKAVLWLINHALFNSFQVYKLQNPGSRLKCKSFLLEVTDYWAGMILEETPEEDYVEAADEDDPSPPTQHVPSRDLIGRLSGDMKEHQFQAIIGVGKKKYPQKPCRVCAAHKKKNKDARYICNTCKVPLHEGDCFTGTTPGWSTNTFGEFSIQCQNI